MITTHLILTSYMHYANISTIQDSFCEWVGDVILNDGQQALHINIPHSLIVKQLARSITLYCMNI